MTNYATLNTSAQRCHHFTGVKQTNNKKQRRENSKINTCYKNDPGRIQTSMIASSHAQTRGGRAQMHALWAEATPCPLGDWVYCLVVPMRQETDQTCVGKLSRKKSCRPANLRVPLFYCVCGCLRTLTPWVCVARSLAKHWFPSIPILLWNLQLGGSACSPHK